MYTLNVFKKKSLKIIIYYLHNIKIYTSLNNNLKIYYIRSMISKIKTIIMKNELISKGGGGKRITR